MLKQLLKKILLKIFDPLALRLGYSKNTFNKNSLLNTFFTTLKAINFSPKHIVDVGANHGTWTRETLKYFPDSYYTLIEPQASMLQSVNDILQFNSKVKFNAVGAGDKPGTFKFTIVDRDDSSSFIYSEAEAKELGYQQVEIPVITLNEFLPQTNLSVPDIIKIDAEGLDLKVLSGANNYFGKTEIFLVEAGVVSKQIPNSFLEVINYMDANGYRLFEITDLNKPFSPAVLWLVELAFVKKDGIIDSHKWIND